MAKNLFYLFLNSLPLSLSPFLSFFIYYYFWNIFVLFINIISYVRHRLNIHKTQTLCIYHAIYFKCIFWKLRNKQWTFKHAYASASQVEKCNFYTLSPLILVISMESSKLIIDTTCQVKFKAADYAPDIALRHRTLPSAGYQRDTPLAVNRWHGSPVGLCSTCWVLDRAAPFARRCRRSDDDFPFLKVFSKYSRVRV